MRLHTTAIETVAKADEERAVATQVMAFSTDPVMRWMYPEAEVYLRHFPKFVRAFGGRAFANGSAYAEARFGGIAMWLPPGVHPDGDAIEAHFRATLVDPVLSETFAVLQRMGELHITEPHWYLPFIGVDPARQGAGIGAALLQHALAICDRDGLPAYLESSNPRNISLYRRHGFEVVGEIQAGSSPVVTPMLRPARRL